MNLKELRFYYPEYDKVPDRELADFIHETYYPDTDKQELDAFLGIEPEKPSGQPFAVTQEPALGPPPSQPQDLPSTGIEPSSDMSKAMSAEDPTKHEGINFGAGMKYLERFAKPFKTQGALAAKSFNQAMAGFSDRLDKMTDVVSRVTGLEKGGVFEAAAKNYQQNADYFDRKAGERGLTDEIVGEIIGGALPGVVEFAAGPAYAGAVGYAEDGAVGAAKGALERGVMGKILHAVNTLKVLPRTVIGAGVGGAEAAAQGGDAREIAKGAASLGAFSAMAGGGGKKSLREAMGRDAPRPKAEDITPPAKMQEGLPLSEAKVERTGEAERKITGGIITEGPQIKKDKIKGMPERGEISYTPEDIAKGFNVIHDGHGLKYDGEQSRAEIGKPPLYQFTPQAGPAKGATFVVEDLTPAAVRNKMREMAKARGVDLSLEVKNGIDVDSIRSKRETEVAESITKESQSGQVTIDLDRKAEYKFNDDLESGWSRAHGATKESLLSRIKTTAKDIGIKLTRESLLPKNEQFADASFALRKLKKQYDVSMETAVKDIAGIVKPLDREGYNLFERKVFLEDMVETGREKKTLPFGLDTETAEAELLRLDKHIESNNPKVKEAISRRKEIWDALKQEYSAAMESVGYDVSKRMTRENYMRHQVLEYVNIKGLWGTGKRLKVPTKRSHLKARKGSALDINTNYLETEYEVMAQINYDIQVAKTIKRIDDKYNIAESLQEDAKASRTDWRDAIPKGYTEWQPIEGNLFYMADTVPARLAEKLMSGAVEKIGITKKQLGKALAIGGKQKSFVIPDELAEQLNSMTRTSSENPLSVANKSILKAWKVWQLISPHRYAKYNLRNITGDLDAVFVGNPGSLKKVPQAVRDLYEAYTKKKMSPDLKAFFERGGMGATLQAQEIGSINSLKMFRSMIKQDFKATDIPGKAWRGYWKAARMSTDFREAILRYASYLDYIDQMMKSNDGMPKNMGASMRAEVEGLEGIEDRAFLMQNDLLGAYDRISIAGQSLREHMYPFWSWKEANAKRYWRMFHNAAHDGGLASAVGRKFLGAAAIKAPYRAYQIGKFVVKASALWAMLQVWNNTRYPDEEKQLPEGVRQKPHIVLGRNKNGDIQYFSRLGSVPDLLEWFGLDAAPEYVDRLLRGESPSKIASEMAKSPVNVLVGGANPFPKLTYELISRRAMWPDIFKPRAIRDRAEHIARSFGLENEYRAIARKPRKYGYVKSWEGSFVYQVDPYQAAYSDVFTQRQRFLKEKGKIGDGFFITEKGNAVYDFKLALRYGDKESAERYLLKYFQLGGTPKGLVTSLKMMDPLAGMDDETKKEFIESMNKEEKLRLTMAYEFYARMFDGNAQVKK